MPCRLSEKCRSLERASFVLQIPKLPAALCFANGQEGSGTIAHSFTRSRPPIIYRQQRGRRLVAPSVWMYVALRYGRAVPHSPQNLPRFVLPHCGQTQSGEGSGAGFAVPHSPQNSAFSFNTFPHLGQILLSVASFVS